MSNFWRSLEIPLINCKVELSLGWYKKCVLPIAGNSAAFTITDVKLYVPIVTLSAEGNVKISKLLSEGFKDQIIGINTIQFQIGLHKLLLIMKKNT